jgi:hypothetical protein
MGGVTVGANAAGRYLSICGEGIIDAIIPFGEREVGRSRSAAHRCARPNHSATLGASPLHGKEFDASRVPTALFRKSERLQTL